jgi:hypothetical protein
MIGAPITDAHLRAGLHRMMPPVCPLQAVGPLPRSLEALQVAVARGEYDDRLGALRDILSGATAPGWGLAAVPSVDARARMISSPAKPSER